MQSIRIYVDAKDEYVEIPVSFNTTFSDIIKCCNVQVGNSYFLIRNFNGIFERVLDLDSSPMDQMGADESEYILHSLKLPFYFPSTNIHEVDELLRKNQSVIDYNKKKTYLMEQKMKILRQNSNRMSYQDQSTKDRMEKRLRMLRSGKAPPDLHSAAKDLEFLKEAFHMAQEDLSLLAERIKMEKDLIHKKDMKMEVDVKLENLRKDDWLLSNQPKKENYMGESETLRMNGRKQMKEEGVIRPQTMFNLISNTKRASFRSQLSATERLIGSRSSQSSEDQTSTKPPSGNFDRSSTNSFDSIIKEKKTYISTLPLISAPNKMLVQRPNSAFTPSKKFSTLSSPPIQTHESTKLANDDATVAYDRDRMSEMKLSNLITQTSEVKKTLNNVDYTPKPSNEKKESKYDFTTKPPQVKKYSTKRSSAPSIHPFNQAFLKTIDKFEELASPTEPESDSITSYKHAILNNTNIQVVKDEKEGEEDKEVREEVEKKMKREEEEKENEKVEEKEEEEEEEEDKLEKNENDLVDTDDISVTPSISKSDDLSLTEDTIEITNGTDMFSLGSSIQQIVVKNKQIKPDVQIDDHEDVIRGDMKDNDKTSDFIRVSRRDSYKEGVRFDDDDADDDVSDINDTDIDDIVLNNYKKAGLKIKISDGAKKLEHKHKTEDKQSKEVEHKIKKEEKEKKIKKKNINDSNPHTNTKILNNNKTPNNNETKINEENHKFFKKPLQDHHQDNNDINKHLMGELMNEEGVKQEIIEGDSFFSIQTSFPAHLGEEEDEDEEDNDNDDEDQEEEEEKNKNLMEENEGGDTIKHNESHEFSMNELLQQMDGSLLRHPAVGVRSLRNRDSYEDHHHHHHEKKIKDDNNTTGSVVSKEDEGNEKCRKKTTLKMPNEGNDITEDDGSFEDEKIKENRESSGSDDEDDEEEEDGGDDDDDRYSPLIDTFTSPIFDSDNKEKKEDKEKSKTDDNAMQPPPQLIRRRFLESQPPEIVGGGVIPFKSNLKKGTKLDKIMEAEKNKTFTKTPDEIAKNNEKKDEKTEKNDEEEEKERRGISFDAVAILLDAALQGELQVVKDIIAQHGHEGMANEEGITALHNSICACNIEISSYLINSACDVNAPDADLWTPLHCAASCSNQSLCKLLIEGGACPFALTLTEDESCFDKCDENDSDDDEDDEGSCALYMKGLETQMQTEGTTLYAAYDYQAQADDEISFKNRDALVYLRGEENGGQNWFYCRHLESGLEGLVPRNYLGLYPRVKS